MICQDIVLASSKCTDDVAAEDAGLREVAQRESRDRQTHMNWLRLRICNEPKPSLKRNDW